MIKMVRGSCMKNKDSGLSIIEDGGACLFQNGTFETFIWLILRKITSVL